MLICSICGAEYTARNNNSKYCPKCRKIANNSLHKQYEKEKRAKSQLRGNDRLDNKLKEIEEYNKEHGTSYTYGMYQALKRLKKL